MDDLLEHENRIRPAREFAAEEARSLGDRIGFARATVQLEEIPVCYTQLARMEAKADEFWARQKGSTA